MRLNPSLAKYSGGAAMKTRRRESFKPQPAEKNPLPTNNNRPKRRRLTLDRHIARISQKNWFEELIVSYNYLR
jgi:hypothetical protein